MAPPHRRPPLLTLRVMLWRLRHVGVVLVIAAGCAGAVRQVAPPPPATRPVVVTAGDVEAGAVLTVDDLRVVHVPLALVPVGANGSVSSLTGRGAAVALPRGLPVLEPLLSGARFTLEPPEGTVVVPVSLTSATTIGLLRVGDLVDLVAPRALGYDEAPAAQDGVGGSGAEVLARAALVVEVAEAAPDDEPVGGLADGRTVDVVTLVAVTPDEGRRLAAASTSGPLGAVLVG